MKSNLAIIENNAIYSPKVKSIAKPKVTTVAKGVKLPTIKESNPIFDRPYGKEGHTFGEALEHSASVYKSLVKQRQKSLVSLKEIGEVLLELRSISGASDKDYGKLVSKTPLGIMSRQDRSDAMWLATEWQNVQTFLKEMDISSGSAAYLRQRMAKAKKSDSKPESTEGTDDKEIVEDNATVEPSTQQSDVVTEKATLDIDSEESFAASIKLIAEKQGLNLAKVVACLIKA
jgi:hypothetical protein